MKQIMLNSWDPLFYVEESHQKQTRTKGQTSQTFGSPVLLPQQTVTNIFRATKRSNPPFLKQSQMTSPCKQSTKLQDDVGHEFGVSDLVSSWTKDRLGSAALTERRASFLRKIPRVPTYDAGSHRNLPHLGESRSFHFSGKAGSPPIVYEELLLHEESRKGQIKDTTGPGALPLLALKCLWVMLKLVAGGGGALSVAGLPNVVSL